MFTKDSLIFIVDDDEPYGKLIQIFLGRQGFRNVTFFQDEKSCLQNMIKCPEVLITDYNLNIMSGLKLIEKARKFCHGIFSILLSGVYHKEAFSDDHSIGDIDKYIIKDNDALNELSRTLDSFLIPGYNYQYY